MIREVYICLVVLGFVEKKYRVQKVIENLWMENMKPRKSVI